MQASVKSDAFESADRRFLQVTGGAQSLLQVWNSFTKFLVCQCSDVFRDSFSLKILLALFAGSVEPYTALRAARWSVEKEESRRKRCRSKTKLKQVYRYVEKESGRAGFGHDHLPIPSTANCFHKCFGSAMWHWAFVTLGELLL